MVEFTLIEDTRERDPWSFHIYDQCIATVRQKLDEGDYTTQEILDLEISTGRKILRLERKASTGEIALNLGKHHARFIKEMERLEPYEHKYLILEFSIDDILDFPVGSKIPKKIWKYLRMNGKLLYNRLKAIEDKYGVELVFSNDKVGAVDAAVLIIENIHNANFS